LLHYLALRLRGGAGQDGDEPEDGGEIDPGDVAEAASDAKHNGHFRDDVSVIDAFAAGEVGIASGDGDEDADADEDGGIIITFSDDDDESADDGVDAPLQGGRAIHTVEVYDDDALATLMASITTSKDTTVHKTLTLKQKVIAKPVHAGSKKRKTQFSQGSNQQANAGSNAEVVAPSSLGSPTNPQSKAKAKAQGGKPAKPRRARAKKWA